MNRDRLVWAIVLALIVVARRKAAAAAALPLGDFSEPGDDTAEVVKTVLEELI